MILMYRQITPKGLEILRQYPSLTSALVLGELNEEIPWESMSLSQKASRLNLWPLLFCCLLFLMLTFFGYVGYRSLSYAPQSYLLQGIVNLLPFICFFLALHIYTHLEITIRAYREEKRENGVGIHTAWKQLSTEMSLVPEEVDIDKSWQSNGIAQIDNFINIGKRFNLIKCSDTVYLCTFDGYSAIFNAIFRIWNKIFSFYYYH